MNLATHYLGLNLRNPLIVGASPFCDDVHHALQLQDAGAAALVMRSLFEEQIAPPPGSGAVHPAGTDYVLSPEQYLRQLRALTDVLKIPVIASLNGHQAGRWLDFGRQLQDAGAAAIELNFYQVVTDVNLNGNEIESAMLRAVSDLASTVSIPVSVKLSPYHTSVAQFAVALEHAGAAGIVLFNRFFQPDINISELDAQSTLQLSDPGELLLRLRWLAILSPQLNASLAATGGLHGSEGVAKALLAGAHAVQLVSILLKEGPRMLTVISRELAAWMRQHGFAGLEDFRGRLNLLRCKDPAAFERANYVRVMQGWSIGGKSAR